MDTIPVQILMDEAIEKGWNRIHFHYCYTSVNFKEIGQFLRAVITGFKNQISAEKEPSSTADSYLLKGCPQICIDKKIRCLVDYCVSTYLIPQYMIDRINGQSLSINFVRQTVIYKP
jgi:hypothetical protein